MAKTTSLVCQHLENISSDALEKYQRVIRDYVRGREGVYALYRHKKLYYVGLAGDLRFRLKQHLRDRHKGLWDRFSVFLTIGSSHLKELESLILQVAKPTGNKQSGKFIKSEDLKRRFAKDIRSLQQTELNSIIGQDHIPALNIRAKKSFPGRQPVLRFVKRAMKLKAKYKGNVVKANVQRDGSILFSGRVYMSPSLAAAAACRRPTRNGWTFWKYERDGDWVSLNELRK